MSVTVRALTGADLEALLPELARLRMQVFREWPYLYEGTFEYEHKYLQSYRNSAGAILIGAFDNARLIGAATGTPLEDHADDFAQPLQGVALERVFYCAESVLLPAYRGQGLGHRFFELREAHARKLGRAYSMFCAVIRPDDHPLRPKDARSLAPFWEGRGYRQIENALAHFGWTDLGEATTTQKPMQLWMKTL